MENAKIHGKHTQCVDYKLAYTPKQSDFRLQASLLDKKLDFRNSHTVFPLFILSHFGFLTIVKTSESST